MGNLSAVRKHMCILKPVDILPTVPHRKFCSQLDTQTKIIGACYLAAEGFQSELGMELERSGRRITSWHGLLAISPDPPVPACWAMDIWLAPELLTATSVSVASRNLRAIQRNWCLLK
jgi:hypothetical protein